MIKYRNYQRTIKNTKERFLSDIFDLIFLNYMRKASICKEKKVIGCLNISGTLVNANNPTTNNVVFFFVSDSKIVYSSNYYIWSQCLGQERKNILRHDLFGDKIIRSSLKKYATHKYDNDVLLRQETQKKIAFPGSWYNSNLKKYQFDVSCSKMHFLPDQKTTIALVSVINH